ncbi:MAG TPA: hypothetical protein PLD59_09785 [Tepidisphaeraceae bacterium]|nr:hypothetical protein [Tepidisphaeraceae bacterium]
MVKKLSIDDLRRESLDDASRMSFAQRFLAGAELFDYACEIARGSIRQQNPDWDPARVDDEIRRRMDIASRLRGRV